MMTTSLKRAAVSILSLVLLAGLVGEARAQNPTPVEMVDGLNAVFGKHPHTRAGHAKGFCVSGNFTPAADAASLSKAHNSPSPFLCSGVSRSAAAIRKPPTTPRATRKGLRFALILATARQVTL